MDWDCAVRVREEHMALSRVRVTWSLLKNIGNVVMISTASQYPATTLAEVYVVNVSILSFGLNETNRIIIFQTKTQHFQHKILLKMQLSIQL